MRQGLAIHIATQHQAHVARYINQQRVVPDCVPSPPLPPTPLFCMASRLPATMNTTAVASTTRAGPSTSRHVRPAAATHGRHANKGSAARPSRRRLVRCAAADAPSMPGKDMSRTAKTLKLQIGESEVSAICLHHKPFIGGGGNKPFGFLKSPFLVHLQRVHATSEPLVQRVAEHATSRTRPPALSEALRGAGCCRAGVRSFSDRLLLWIFGKKTKNQ